MKPDCPPANQLEKLVLGLLPDDSSVPLEEHLLACQGCQQTVAGLHADDTVVQSLRAAQSEQPLPAKVEQLMEQLGQLQPRIQSAESVTQAASQSGSDVSSVGYDFLLPPLGPDELGRLGSYRVLRELGSGGMGVVFLAEDPHLQRLVALKAMKPSLSGGSSAVQRFLREAQATAAIKHDHIVTIYQVGEDRGVPFLAMEFLEGEPLDQFLHRVSTLPVPEIVRLGKQVALGLAAAHKRGLIHRDIKPANIWLETKDEDSRAKDDPSSFRVKILDFGLARAAGQNSQLTQQGAIVGTPAYMAPEQGRGETVDARCDLFSLGCVLYRMAAGVLPFKGNDTVSALLAVALHEPPPPSKLNPEVPAALSDLIMKLLTKDPAQRCQSALEVVEALTRLEAPPARTVPQPMDAATLPRTLGAQAPRSPRRWPLIAAGLFLLLGGALLLPQIILRITDPDGKKRDIELKPGSKFEIVQKDDLPPVVAALQLDPALIPAAERFPWQPKELVAVLGEHQRHWSTVNNLSFSHDGKTVASCSAADSEFYLWDADTARVRERMSVEAPPYQVLFSPTRNMLAACCRPDVLLWNLDVSRVPKSLGVRDVNWAAFSPDGKLLACTDLEKVFIFDLTGNEPKKCLDLNVPARRLTFSPNGKLFACGLYRDTVLLWDVAGQEFKDRAPIKGDQSFGGMAFTPDSKSLVTRNTAATLRFWDLSGAEPREQLKADFNNGWPDLDSPLFAPDSPDGKKLPLIGDGIWFLDLSGPKPTISPPYIKEWLRDDGKIGAAVYSPDGKRLVTGDALNRVRFWDVTGPAPVERQPLSFALGKHVRYADGGKLLATSDLRTVSLWDVSGTQPRLRHVVRPKFSLWNYRFDISPDGKLLATAHQTGGILWDLAGDEAVDVAFLKIGTPSYLRFSPDGKTLAVNAQGNNKKTSVKFLDVTARPPAERRIVALPIENVGSHDCRFDADGGQLATLDGDTVRIWDVGGQEARLITSFKDGRTPGQIAFAKNGQMIATAGNNAQLWDVRGATPTAHQFFDGLTRGQVFTLDSKTYIRASGREIEFWDILSPEQLKRLAMYGDKQKPRLSWKLPGAVNSFDITPDGKYLAAANNNGTVYIYTLEGKPPQPMALPTATSPFDRFQQKDIPESALMLAGFVDGAKPPPELVGILGDPTRRHDTFLDRLVFSPDGKTLAARGFSSHWVFWDAETFSPQQVFRVPPTKSDLPVDNPNDAFDPGESRMRVGQSSNHLVFSPDGKYFVVNNGKGKLQIIDRQTNKVKHAVPVGTSVFMTIDATSTLLGVDDNRQIVIWNLISGEKEHGFEKTAGHHYDGVFTPDRKTLLTQNSDAIYHWSLIPGVPYKKLNYKNDSYQETIFSPDGKLLARFSPAKGPAVLVDAQTGQELREMDMKELTRGGGEALAFHPNGMLLAMSYRTGFVLWDIATGKQLPIGKYSLQPDTQKLKYARREARRLAFSPDGKFLVTGHSHEIIRWDLVTGKEVGSSAADPIGGFKNILFASAAKTIVTSAPGSYYQGDGTFRLWDLSSPLVKGSISSVTLLAREHNTNVVLNPAADRLLVTFTNVHSQQGAVQSLDLAKRKIVPSLVEKRLQLGTMAYLPGKNLLVGRVLDKSGNYALKVTNPDTGTEIATLSTQLNHSNAHFEFDNSGRFVVACDGRVIELWDVEKQALRATYTRQGKTTVALQKVKMHCGPRGDLIVAQDSRFHGLYLVDPTPDDKGELRIAREVAMPASLGDFDISGDGSLLASYHDDGAVRVWSFPEMEPLRTIPINLPYLGGSQFPDKIRIAFAPDGRHLVVGHLNGTLSIVRVRPAEQPAALKVSASPFDDLRREAIPEHEMNAAGFGDRTRVPAEVVGILGDSRLQQQHWPIAMDFSPDGSMLAASTFWGEVTIWDAKSFQVRHFLYGVQPENKYAYDVKFSPDGKLLAVGFSGRTELWDTQTGRRVHDFGHGAQKVVFAANGKWLVSADMGLTRVYDVATKELVYSRKNLGSNTRLAAVRDDGVLITLEDASKDAGWFSWNLAAKSEAERISVPLPQGLGNYPVLAISADGRRTAFPSSQSPQKGMWPVPVYDTATATGKVVADIAGKGSVDALALNQDGTRLALGSQADITVWDVTSTAPEKPLLVLPRFASYVSGGNNVRTLVFSPDSKTLASGHSQGLINMYDLATGKLKYQHLQHLGAVKKVLVSGDGKTLITAGQEDGAAHVWDVIGPQPRLRKVVSFEGNFNNLALSPDGTLLAKAKSTGVELQDLATGKTEALAGGNTSSGLAFSPDGKKLCFTAMGKPRILNLQTKKTEAFLAAEDAPYLAYSPDGRHVASYSAKGAITLWDAPSGLKLAEVKTGHCRGLVFHPDGKQLISVTSENAIQIYDTTPTATKELRSLRSIALETRPTAYALSPNGMYLATANALGRIFFWETATLKLVYTIDSGSCNRIEDLAFTADGRHLITGNGNGTVYILRLSATAGEADLARWVLDRGGEVTLQLPGQQTLQLAGAAASTTLPETSFVCRDVVLRDSPEVNDHTLGKFGPLQGLAGLASLKISNCPITDAGVRQLLGFPSLRDLEELSLEKLAFTDAVLKDLPGFSKLKSLDLGYSTEFTDAGLEAIGRMASLESLDLSGTNATARGVQHLRGLKLHTLSLADATGISDLSMELLKDMATLTSVNLHKTAVTVAGMQQLQKALPKCKIQPAGP